MIIFHVGFVFVALVVFFVSGVHAKTTEVTGDEEGRKKKNNRQRKGRQFARKVQERRKKIAKFCSLSQDSYHLCSSL